VLGLVAPTDGRREVRCPNVPPVRGDGGVEAGGDEPSAVGERRVPALDEPVRIPSASAAKVVIRSVPRPDGNDARSSTASVSRASIADEGRVIPAIPRPSQSWCQPITVTSWPARPEG
jgi:hypothetical protein